jgi:hypothetical protein
MVSRMKRSVASCSIFKSSMESKKLSCPVTVPTRSHDAVLAARELADARGPHPHIDLSLHLPYTQWMQVQGKGADGPLYAAGSIGTTQA